METNIASTMMEAADFSKIVVTICENTQRTSKKILSLCKNEISFLFVGLKVPLTSQVFGIFCYLRMAKLAQTCCNE